MTVLMINICDKLLSSLALVILSPLLLIICLILTFTGEGEIFYKQPRLGKNAKVFHILKFATMLRDSSKIGSGELTLIDDYRVLPVGKFLRKWKLNELPQLINVLVGDMSLVGPRPHTLSYANCFHDNDLIRIYSVKPGLSGLGSLIFRDEETILSKVPNPIEFDEKFIMPYKGKIESWFVEKYSFRLYALIIMLTIFEVARPGKLQISSFFDHLPKPPENLEKLL